jgi:pimeloyl-ACP methyl ester carboxylesterase
VWDETTRLATGMMQRPFRVFVAVSLVACTNESQVASRDSVAVVDSGYVAIDGGRLYYEAAGSGNPVILIHGGNLDRRMWDDQFALLQKQFRVIRYDARGYGRSSPADEPFAAHDDLAALVRGLGLTRASIVGLSLGGRIALDFALEHPENVDRLVLAAPGISGGKWAEDGDTLWIAEAIAAGKRGDSVGVALAWLKSAYINSALKPPAQAEWLRQISVDNARYWMGIVRHQDVEREATPPAAGRLRELKAPILLLVGGADTPFIMDVARAITREAPNVRRVDLAGIGHMINLEAPERFNTEVVQFLATSR